MTILITNDDGITAPGLDALRDACRSLGINASQIHTVAPDRELSQNGHRITTYEPIPVESLDPQRHSVSGTPADCVRLGIAELLPQKPDLILAGINPGGNMGHDLYISGTVAAVREAAYHGIPAIAISHYLKNELNLCWESASQSAARVLKKLLNQKLGDGFFWNVNLPHLPADAPEPELIFDCPPERQPLPNAFQLTADGYLYTGDYSQRPQTPSSDVSVCFGGNIAISKISV
ncbi:MAG: 5'/3'-nucleotidase SurE [Verrucomicrobiales bacterium]|nr:5'/3'-nucleotidase SurE [Verrucomicrobiales bacterium]